MKKPTVYLSGRMCGRPYEDVEQERLNARAWLEKFGFRVLDPLRGKESLRGSVISNECAYKEFGGMEEIIRRDKEDIDNSDALLVITDRVSDGTWMEIGYARYKRGIPVFVASPQLAGKHGWVNYETYVFHKLEDAIHALVFHFAEALLKSAESNSSNPIYIVQLHDNTACNGSIDSVWEDKECAQQRATELNQCWGRVCWMTHEYRPNRKGDYGKVEEGVK